MTMVIRSGTDVTHVILESASKTRSLISEPHPPTRYSLIAVDSLGIEKAELENQDFLSEIVNIMLQSRGPAARLI